MKCNATVFYGKHRRKNASDQIKPIGWITNYSRELYASPENMEALINTIERMYVITKKEEVCGGEIESIMMYSPGYYVGGADPEFEIRYRCKKCGNTNFTGLPTEIDELNKFMTAAIKNL